MIYFKFNVDRANNIFEGVLSAEKSPYAFDPNAGERTVELIKYIRKNYVGKKVVRRGVETDVVICEELKEDEAVKAGKAKVAATRARNLKKTDKK